MKADAVGAAMQHTEIECQHRQNKQIEKHPKDEHRESYDRNRQVSRVRYQVAGKGALLTAS